ncbi:hypothetical protein [Chromobacterium subtsugae]|uniref:hypothetical protein n=1 Tax=Chromobacterium subtsugae TaxID=251747 RepID=UPI0006417D0D|nr:hypothetical protein [Chromobacterium subtsugae]
MKGVWMGGLAALSLLSGWSRAEDGAAAASAPRVQLECLPAADAAGGWQDWLATRLSLRGLEVGAPPRWRLCFTEEVDRQWVERPVDWRYDGYWGQPPYRLESWPALALTVKNADGAVFWQGRERLGEGANRRQQLEQAARRLLERMPAP